jgi:hypothetical protein
MQYKINIKKSIVYFIKINRSKIDVVQLLLM